MGVLPDHYIKELCETQTPPLIDPFIEDHLQPSSYDVRLANKFIVFEPHDEHVIDLDDPHITTKLVTASTNNGFVLHAGEFALGATQELVAIPDNLVSHIEGKSSMGRLGLQVHATAGYIDPGFYGAITVELHNLLRVPIVLRPGKKIAQLSFEYLESPCRIPYNGRYQGDRMVAPYRDLKSDMREKNGYTIDTANR